MERAFSSGVNVRAHTVPFTGPFPGELLYHYVFCYASPFASSSDLAGRCPSSAASDCQTAPTWSSNGTFAYRHTVYISPCVDVGTPMTDPLFFLHHGVSNHDGSVDGDSTEVALDDR